MGGPTSAGGGRPDAKGGACCAPPGNNKLGRWEEHNLSWERGHYRGWEEAAGVPPTPVLGLGAGDATVPLTKSTELYT